MVRRRRHTSTVQTGAGETLRRSHPINYYLWALIICSVVPLLCFQAYTVTRSSLAEAQLAENKAEQITHAISDVINRELDELEGSLAVLADAPSLKARDLGAFYKAALEFGRHNGSGIVLTDREGQQLMNTRSVFGGPLPKSANLEAVAKVVHTGRPVITNMFVAGFDKTLRVAIVFPVMVNDRTEYVLLASWSLTELAVKLSVAQIPPGWPATVLDGKGVRLWRNSFPELIGKPVRADFFQMLKASKTRRIENTTAGQRIDVVNFTSDLSKANWTVIVGVPQTALQEPFRRSIALLSGAGVLALLFSLTIAGWISRKVKNEIQAAASEAERLDHGDQPSPIRLDIRELQSLGWAIVEAGVKRNRAELALRASEERWKFALEGAGDGVWDWNVQTGVVIFSKRWNEMLGFAENETGSHVDDWMRLIHPDDLAVVRAKLKMYFASAVTTEQMEYRMRHKDGSWVWIVSRGMLASRTDDGKPLRMIGTNTDINERKRMEHELMQMATTDFLTGLANRRCFIARMEEELARMQRLQDQPTSVLMLDLDHFKRINDNYGHAAGDAMLRHFADLIREGPRKVDFVSRLGGEEFAILLIGTPADAAMAVAERLCEKVAAQPLHYNGSTIALTVSIGIAAMLTSDTSAATALSRADAALYQAKESGRNRAELAA